MAPAKRFICIHGHFYQPPRENPWLETVETQDSAAPYHDWNERVCAECYATNGAARIQNNKNQIIAHREQLCADQLQLRANAAELAQGECAAHLPHDSGWRAAQPAGATRGTARRWRRFTTTSSCRWRAGATASRRSAGALRTIEYHYGSAAGRHVAGGDGGGHGVAGAAGGARHQVHGAGAAPVQADSAADQAETAAASAPASSENDTECGAAVDRHGACVGGYDAAVSGALRLGRVDRGFLLQRADLAGDCV